MIRYQVVQFSSRSSVLTENSSIDFNEGRHHISIDMDEEAVSERYTVC